MKIVEEFRHLKEALIKTYNKVGAKRLEEYMSCCGIPFIAGWSLILEDVDDKVVEDKVRSLKEFYQFD